MANMLFDEEYPHERGVSHSNKSKEALDETVRKIPPNDLADFVLDALEVTLTDGQHAAYRAKLYMLKVELQETKRLYRNALRRLREINKKRRKR